MELLNIQRSNHMEKDMGNSSYSLPSKRREALPKKKMNEDLKCRFIFLAAAAALIFTFVASLSLGRYAVPFGDAFKIILSKFFSLTRTWTDISESVVMDLRFPRTVAAIVVGAALALSGGTYQSIFKNPMCSPDLLGVSSGACIGAAIAILANGGSVIIQAGAFAGGIIAVAITVTIPRLLRNESTVILILTGVVVSGLMSSIMSLLKFVADTDTKLAEITYWTMGSFAAVSLKDMLPVLPSIVIPSCIILLMRYRLNVLSLGDNEARSLGVNLQRTRGVFIVCSTLISASCICLSGTIGWVGLVIPHTARMAAGSDNEKMLPISMLFGAVFMLIIDICCRTITAAELRIGILTGIIGAPFFIFILFQQNRELK